MKEISVLIYALIVATVSSWSGFSSAYPSSPKDLCFVSLMDRYLWSSKKMSLATQKTTPVEKRISNLKSLIDQSAYRHDWESSLIPVRENQGFIFPYPDPNFSAPTMKGYIKECMLEEAEQRSQSEFSAPQKTMLVASCFSIAPGDALKCQQGVSKLYRESKSSQCITIATNYAKVWAERFGDQKFFKGLGHASGEIIKAVKSESVSYKNLFELLQTSMESASGYTKSEATDAAWDATMMVANSSHDFNRHVGWLSKEYSEGTNQAMYNISHVQNIIDFDESALTATPFSFPTEIKGRCQTTKPYHFWMAAYQARSLVKAGFSAREAVAAVLTYAKAYHTHTGGTETSGGNPFRTSLALIFQMPFDHPTVSVLRHDLVLNIIGATYGAGLLKNKSINITDVMDAVFKERPRVGDLDYKTEAIPMASDQLKAYTFWEKMFNPNGIYKIVMNNIK